MLFDDRNHVAEVLGKIRDPAAVEPLMHALRDQDRFLRSSAAESLGKVRDDRALDPLIDALHDNEPIVRKSAAGSLGKLGLPKAIGPLIETLRDLDPDVRWEATRSLDELGWTPSNEEDQAYYSIASFRWPEVVRLGKPAIPPLIQTLRGPDGIIEETAISTLAKIAVAGGEPAISLLIDGLRDEAHRVRSNISLALGKIGEKAVPLLLRAVKDDDSNVRSGAKSALARIDDSRP